MWLRILKQNDLRGVDFDSDLTSNPDWAGSYANHVDLPRIREGRLGGQVCINSKVPSFIYSCFIINFFTKGQLISKENFKVFI